MEEQDYKDYSYHHDNDEKQHFQKVLFSDYANAQENYQSQQNYMLKTEE